MTINKSVIWIDMKLHLLIAAAFLSSMPMLALAVKPAESTATARKATTPFVVGLAPWQRPGGAPVVRRFTATADWRRQALTGISDPLPASISFLDHQGAWYTPFNQPGMPGPYDLRQWHQGDAAKPANTLKR